MVSASALHGDIPQSLRERTVDHIKQGVIDILIATDVVARGLMYHVLLTKLRYLDVESSTVVQAELRKVASCWSY